VAVRGSGTLGFACLRDDGLDHLYVDPANHRRGVGRALLDRAKAASPSRLTSWTFQRNAGARAFYGAQGFRAVEPTDGAGNEEREPDVRYASVPHSAALAQFRIRSP